MSAADRITGSNVVGRWIHSGGTAVITGDANKLNVTRQQNVVNATAYGDGAEVNKPTYKVFGATLEGYFIGTAGSATLGSVALGGEGTLVYGVAGTATGKPKGSFPAIVTKADIDAPYDNMVTFKFEFKGQGNEIDNPFTAVF